MELNDLVLAVSGRGRMVEHGNTSRIFTHFEENSVGVIRAFEGDDPIVLLVGPNQQYAIPVNEIEPVNVEETGDLFAKCHSMA